MSKFINTESISLQALINGDRTEFAKVVDTSYQPLYHLLLRILNDPQDVEDALQETFLKAFRAIRTFEGRSNLSTWLYRIATNEGLMLLRKRRPDLQAVDDEDDKDEGEDSNPIQLVDWCCLPEQEMLTTETKFFLERALQELSSNLKTVFLLRDVEGLSIHETAEALNLSEEAVKVRLLRARLKMRDLLSVYFTERMKEKPVT